MLTTKFTPLNREQFSLLRETKRLVAAEFNQDLKIQDKDILDQIYGFALESEGDRLFEIFNELHSSVNGNTPGADSQHDSGVVVSSPRFKKQAAEPKASAESVKVGDIVGGKRCTGFYRGQPVYKQGAA